MFRLRVVVEAVAQVLKAAATIALLATLGGRQAALSLCFAQLIYGATASAGYFWAFRAELPQLFGIAVGAKGRGFKGLSSGGCRRLLRLVGGFSLQAVEKLVLAEGSKLVMAALESRYHQATPPFYPLLDPLSASRSTAHPLTHQDDLLRGWCRSPSPSLACCRLSSPAPNKIRAKRISSSNSTQVQQPLACGIQRAWQQWHGSSVVGNPMLNPRSSRGSTGWLATSGLSRSGSSSSHLRRALSRHLWPAQRLFAAPQLEPRVPPWQPPALPRCSARCSRQRPLSAASWRPLDLHTLTPCCGSFTAEGLPTAVAWRGFRRPPLASLPRSPAPLSAP